MKHPVKAKWFCKHEDGGQIKLNWFLYEVALSIFDEIMDSDELKIYRTEKSIEEIAHFSYYFAKRMKKSIFDQLSGITPETIIDEEYISDYYPEYSRKKNVTLLNAGCDAWAKLLDKCIVCPHRCISEKERPTHMFKENTL